MNTEYSYLVPIQTFGIGDIIWEQTLVQIIAQGKPVIWPTEPQFVEGLNRAYPHIQFTNKHLMDIEYGRMDDYIANERRHVPLRFADSIVGVPYHQVMMSKYMMFQMDWQIWREHAMWKRDAVRENALVEFLGLPEQFILVNRHYGSDSKLKADIEINSDLPVIEMRTIDKFSLFDWAAVIERATHIHTVSTSIIYLLEMLDITAEEIHLYTRKPHEPHFKNIDYILQKHQYKFHL